jgi:hypothetical protein
VAGSFSSRRDGHPAGKRTDMAWLTLMVVTLVFAIEIAWLCRC